LQVSDHQLGNNNLSRIFLLPRPHALSTRRRNPDDLYQDVQLQTWATVSSRKYWIVRGALTHDQLRIFSGSSHLDAIHQRERAHIAACDQEAMQETGVKELELTSPWMEANRDLREDLPIMLRYARW
jgi:hypothetical protein